MRVKISFTVDVSEEFREALAHRFGWTGKASRQDIKDHYQSTAFSTDDDILHEYQCRSAPEGR